MVSTVEEDGKFQLDDNTMLTKGKQSRVRKSSGSAKKGSASKSTTCIKRSSRAVETVMPSEMTSSLSVLPNNMGNITSVLSANEIISMSFDEPPAIPSEVLNSNSNETCEKKDISDDHVQISQAEINNVNDTNMETEVPQLHQANSWESAVAEKTTANNNTASNESERQKQLLLLQLSLISRQQDLLRLRDREIMQLKASNQNYKCQLNRIRRRMSSKGDSGWECVKSSSAAHSSNSNDFAASLRTPTAICKQEPNSTESRCDVRATADGLEDTPSTNTIKRRKMMSKDKPDVEPMVSTGTNETPKDTNETDRTSNNLVQTPSSSKTSLPVPLSFIERRQNELFDALMVSPPDRALRNFCDIAGTSSQLADFPFKICDRCPHCVAIAAEITRLIKIAEISETFSSKQQRQFNKEHSGIMKLAAVDIPKTGGNEKRIPPMRTPVSYYRHSPNFDMDHFWWDLKCGSIELKDKLNTPTWTEKIFLPISTEMPAGSEGNLEISEDSAYMKRHVKFELDEKRRKRWDIQRIREYRYNEKLRQKLLKQATIYEVPVIDTFSGHLHDALSVEVHKSLPVNVFGYPAPQLHVEEFNLTDMYQMTRILSSRAVKRKQR